MQIIVTPNDIIQRCLWDKYKKFCLHDKDEKEITKLVENNKPISLSENDAYVIGLLKVIETDNFVHRFNEDTIDFLQIKSSIVEDDLHINKNSFNKFVNNYQDKFPSYYNPNASYKIGLENLDEYLTLIKTKMENLEEVSVENRGKTFVYYISRDVKKVLVL